MSEWGRVEDIGYESERPYNKSLWECGKCGIFYEVVWEVKSITPLSELKKEVMG